MDMQTILSLGKAALSLAKGACSIWIWAFNRRQDSKCSRLLIHIASLQQKNPAQLNFTPKIRSEEFKLCEHMVQQGWLMRGFLPGSYILARRLDF